MSLYPRYAILGCHFGQKSEYLGGLLASVPKLQIADQLCASHSCSISAGVRKQAHKAEQSVNTAGIKSTNYSEYHCVGYKYLAREYATD